MCLLVLVCTHGEGDAHLLWVLLAVDAHALQRQTRADGAMFGGEVVANGSLRLSGPNSCRRLAGLDGVGTDDLRPFRIPESKECTECVTQHVL